MSYKTFLRIWKIVGVVLAAQLLFISLYSSLVLKFQSLLSRNMDMFDGVRNALEEGLKIDNKVVSNSLGISTYNSDLRNTLYWVSDLMFTSVGLVLVYLIVTAIIFAIVTNKSNKSKTTRSVRNI